MLDFPKRIGGITVFGNLFRKKPDNKIRVLVFNAETRTLTDMKIENEMGHFHKIVDGYYERIDVTKHLDLYVNESANPPDFHGAFYLSHEGEVFRTVYGNCIFASKAIEGKIQGLNDFQIGFINDRFAEGQHATGKHPQALCLAIIDLEESDVYEVGKIVYRVVGR